MKKKLKPVVISRRKAEIYNRRNPDVSSLEESHALLKEVDPDLTSLLELKREILLEEKLGGIK